MVEGYFTELAFVYAEIYRVCAPKAIVAFVNDNVRYGGEVIPVDFLSSLFAEQLGFKVKKFIVCSKKRGIVVNKWLSLEKYHFEKVLVFGKKNND